MPPHPRRTPHILRAALGAALTLAAAAPLAAQAVATPAAASAGAGSATTSAKIGPGLYEVVASPSRNAVYVASAGSRTAPGGKIFELDPTTMAVRSTIDVSAAPAYGLGLNDRTGTLYTSNTRNGSVSAIDLRSGKIVATITSPADSSAHVFRVLVDESANMVYVSVAGTPGRVWVIDGRTNTLAHVIDSVGTRTTGLAIDTVAKRLYASSLATNEIVVVDLATHKVVGRMPAGGERPTQLAFDGATGRLFVTNQGTGDVSVLDTRAGKVLATVKTGAGALGIGHDAARDRVYVANRQAGTVTVVDATSYAVVEQVQAGSLPNTVAIEPRTSMVYVTNKARSAPRDQPPVDDPAGDTVTRIAPQ